MNKIFRTALLVCAALAICVALQVSAYAQAKGMDVTEVRIAASGLAPETIYRQSGAKSWQVISRGTVGQTCSETNRDEWSVYLDCAQNNVKVVLNLFNKERSIIGTAGSTLKSPIASSSNAPVTAPVNSNNTKVTEISFGPQSGERGLFRQVGDRAWELRRGGRPNDKLETTCTELSRGAAEVLLSCQTNAYQYEINFNTMNVTKIVGSQRTFADQVKNTDTFQVIADSDLRDPFRPGEIVRIMNWIAKETSNSQISYCYKNTKSRGVGVPLTTCPGGTDRGTPPGALCYPNCRTGFTGAGPVCWGVCPQGFNDIGAFCQKPAEYTRDSFGWQVGYPPLPQPGAFEAMKRACEAKYGTGNCEIKGAAAYPNCKVGYKEGSAVWNCRPACPAGWDDTGTGCTKPSYGRGVGAPMNCSPGLEEQAGLCYQRCANNTKGVGPICWQNCGGRQQHECVLGCASDPNSCVSATADMILAPINLIIGLVDMGISAKISAAAKAAAKGGLAGAAAQSGQLTALTLQNTPKWAKLFEGLKSLDNTTKAAGVILDTANISQGLRDEIEKWTAEVEDNFAANTSPEIEWKIRNEFDYNTQRYIKRYWAVHHLGSMLESDAFRIGKLVTSVVATTAGLAGDPGFVATINAYSQPMCPTTEGNPFPRPAGFAVPNRPR